MPEIRFMCGVVFGAILAWVGVDCELGMDIGRVGRMIDGLIENGA